MTFEYVNAPAADAFAVSRFDRIHPAAVLGHQPDRRVELRDAALPAIVVLGAHLGTASRNCLRVLSGEPLVRCRCLGLRLLVVPVAVTVVGALLAPKGEALMLRICDARDLLRLGAVRHAGGEAGPCQFA